MSKRPQTLQEKQPSAIPDNEALQEPNVKDMELGNASIDDNISPKSTSEDVAPDGLKAWLVAAGSCAIFFSSLGFVNSFGTFEQYYLTHQLRGRSPDDIAWIGSIAAFLQFAVGMVAGPLFDRFGAWILRPACVAYVFAIMMLSLCTEFYQIMLTQGILMGVCLGMMIFPSFAAVSQYFDKKRAAALGLTVAGSSLGGIVIPIALAKMLNGTNLGFGWSVRIIGFAIIPFMAFGCFTIQARLPPRTSTFWIAAAFKEKKFILLIISFAFAAVGAFTPLFFLPTYAVFRGMDPTLAGYMLAIINASSTFGRVIPGILADKFGRLNIFGLAGLATGICVFCLNSATSTAGIIVYSVVFGFVSGTIISGASAAFSNCPEDARDTGTYLVNGALVNIYGGFFEVSMFSGSMSLVGGMVALAAKATTPEGLLGRV